MGFLFKAAFWLSLVILFMPAEEMPAETAEATLSAGEAIGVASATVSDLAEFCGRNPETCEAGEEAFRTFSRKAQYGAKLLYNYLDELNDEPATSHSANTLSPEDQLPQWRGPGQEKA